MVYLSVVIPAYNEENKISKDIEAVYKYFNENSIDGELIIVNDGSTDQTYDIASGFSKRFLSLKVITYNKNRGKGYAVKTGMLAAGGEYILFADSGLCVPFKCANEGIKLLNEGYDIAIGSRTPNQNAKILLKQPLYRRLGSNLFHFLIKTFKIIPEGIEDIQCGFKLFKKEIAHKLFNKIFTEKFMWDLELLRIVNRENYKIATFGTEWSNDPDTRFHPFIGSFENLFQVITIIFRT